MTEPIPFDEHAERLKIRSQPAPTTRINRKVLVVGAGLGALALFAAASVALKPPTASTASRPELYNTTNTRPPEGLADLPASYSDVAPLEARIPRLGPPLAGDLGSTMLETEQQFGITPDYTDDYVSDFRPNPISEAERAARLKTAALAEEAARAPVFFQLQSKTGPKAASTPRSSSAAALDLSSELLALAAAPPVAGFQNDPNLQARKRAFASGRGDTSIYEESGLQAPASPYQVMAGTLIPASLITGLNSDLPGTLIAQVTQPVYDTVSGRHVLIPQGSRLIGRYQSEVSFGQDRALVTWDRIIFPNGNSIQISAPGADVRGLSGLSDKTNNHWGRVFTAAGLATILGIGSEIGASSDDDLIRAIRRGTSETINEAGQRVVDRSLGVQPTLTVRPGWPVRVIVTRDLILSPQAERH